MNNESIRLYRWEGLHWDIDYDINGNPYFQIPLCPKQKCNCKLKKSKEVYSLGEYKYCCVRCDFKITLNKSIEDKAIDLLDIVESQKYKDAEIINLDGELIRIQREQIADSDYWVNVTISKNKKDEVQLMVLAGSKSDKNKTQLFLDPKSERLSFDQNDDHPREVFSKVTATFRKSKVEIQSNEDVSLNK
jgi:hypothetical protein